MRQIDYFLTNIQGDEEKKSVRIILKGNKLPYKEANSPLPAIMSAIIIEDGEDDEIIPEFTGKDEWDETITEEHTINKKEDLSQRNLKLNSLS